MASQRNDILPIESCVLVDNRHGKSRTDRRPDGALRSAAETGSAFTRSGVHALCKRT